MLNFFAQVNVMCESHSYKEWSVTETAAVTVGVVRDVSHKSGVVRLTLRCVVLTDSFYCSNLMFINA